MALQVHYLSWPSVRCKSRYFTCLRLQVKWLPSEHNSLCPSLVPHSISSDRFWLAGFSWWPRLQTLRTTSPAATFVHRLSYPITHSFIHPHQQGQTGLGQQRRSRLSDGWMDGNAAPVLHRAHTQQRQSQQWSTCVLMKKSDTCHIAPSLRSTSTTGSVIFKRAFKKTRLISIIIPRQLTMPIADGQPTGRESSLQN